MKRNKAQSRTLIALFVVLALLLVAVFADEFLSNETPDNSTPQESSATDGTFTADLVSTEPAETATTPIETAPAEATEPEEAQPSPLQETPQSDFFKNRLAEAERNPESALADCEGEAVVGTTPEGEPLFQYTYSDCSKSQTYAADGDPSPIAVSTQDVIDVELVPSLPSEPLEDHINFFKNLKLGVESIGNDYVVTASPSQEIIAVAGLDIQLLGIATQTAHPFAGFMIDSQYYEVPLGESLNVGDYQLHLDRLEVTYHRPLSVAVFTVSEAAQ